VTISFAGFPTAIAAGAMVANAGSTYTIQKCSDGKKLLNKYFKTNFKTIF